MKRDIRPILLVLYFGFFFLAVLALGYYWHNYRQTPEQPIHFPHNIHAGKVGLPCTYCHADADRSIHAGIPPVQTCVACHENIATDRPEIQKLLKFWQEQKPIPWAKVHTLPAHVYFTHKRHIKAGLDCSACHGDVKNMGVAQRVSSLKMGWCVSCHREKKASIDCLTCHH